MMFVSKKREHRMVRKPSDRIMDEFRRPIILRGERVEFHDFRYETEDPDMIEWLLTNPSYGLDYTSNAPDKGALKVDTKVPTGPEVTDDIYRKEMKTQQVEMIRGATNTAKIQMPLPTPTTDTAPITEEAVGKLIDSKLEAGFAKLMSALTAAKQEESAPKAKHVVHCKDCGQAFGSGFEVGMHKKKDCPATKKE